MLKAAGSDTLTSIRATAKDSFDRLELIDKTCHYAYSTEMAHHFLDPATLEEWQVPLNYLRDKTSTLLENGSLSVHVL